MVKQPQWRLYITPDGHKRYMRPKDSTKDMKLIEHTCVLTGEKFERRGVFWNHIKKNKLNAHKMTYDRVVTCENTDLMDKSHLKWLWTHYFEEKGNKNKLENLIGSINLELYIILLKVYRGDMDIDDCLEGNLEESVDEEGVEEESEEEVIEGNSFTSDITNSYKFILGDCLESLKNIDDKSIDLVVTSPPYNIGLKYHKYKDKKPRDQYLEWIFDIFVEMKRVLKEDGHIFLNMGYTNKDPWISMEVALKLKGLLVLQNNITWVKSISIGENKDDTYGHFKPINSDRYINVTNENLYHFTKSDKVKINREAIGVPYKWKCNLIDRKTGKHRINKKTGKPVEDKRCKGNTWFIPYETIWNKSQKGFHPATFPEGLVEHCIKISDVKKGTILDPFVGSGTTVRTAKKMSNSLDEYELSGIGFDIDETYIDYCNESINC